MTSAHYSLLTIHADLVDDLEKARIAAENRLRAVQDVKGLADAKEYARLEELVAGLQRGEHLAVLELQKAMRSHPLGDWVGRTLGVGEKQAARLIGAVGPPHLRFDKESGEWVPRTVSQLWAYCGYRPGQKRQKGVQSNWNSTAKMRAFLIAESCMKQMASPYRPLYESAKANWAERDVPDAHKHAHALRVVAKEILKDLWREGRGEATREAVTESDAPAAPPAEDMAEAA